MTQQRRCWGSSVWLANLNIALLACLAGKWPSHAERPIAEDRSRSLWPSSVKAALDEALRLDAQRNPVQQARSPKVSYAKMLAAADASQKKMQERIAQISGKLTDKANNAAEKTNRYVEVINNLHEGIGSFQGSVNRLREASAEMGRDTDQRLVETVDLAAHEATEAGRSVRNMRRANESSGTIALRPGLSDEEEANLSELERRDAESPLPEADHAEMSRLREKKGS